MDWFCNSLPLLWNITKTRQLSYLSILLYFNVAIPIEQNSCVPYLKIHVVWPHCITYFIWNQYIFEKVKSQIKTNKLLYVWRIIFPTNMINMIKPEVTIYFYKINNTIIKCTNWDSNKRKNLCFVQIYDGTKYTWKKMGK